MTKTKKYTTVEYKYENWVDTFKDPITATSEDKAWKRLSDKDKNKYAEGKLKILEATQVGTDAWIPKRTELAKLKKVMK